MPKFSTEGKHLKYQDLNGSDMVLTIKRYAKETLKGKDGSENRKWVLYFNEIEQGLALNATNGSTISKVLGTDEMDNWIGQRITLYEKDDVEMGGELVSGIRVRPKKPA